MGSLALATGCPGSNDSGADTTAVATGGLTTGGSSSEDIDSVGTEPEADTDAETTQATATGGTDTGEPSGPHALGTILLGEVHPAEGGNATPIVSISFIPDAALAGTACSQQVAGCEVSFAADCGEAGCDPGEYCGFDNGCQATCLDVCDADCAAGEVCYFASPGNAACKAIEDFDAGALTFGGTTTALTLFPPYTFDGDASGAPFAPGASLTVDASGANTAGYTAFEREFTATELLQSDIENIGLVDAYGDGPIPVTWVPGGESVTVSALVWGVSGSSGSIVCVADDAAGAFSFPREPITAATNNEALTNLTLTVTRRRTQLHTDLTTTGELLEVAVQEVGWLELVTMSSETQTIQGCGPGEALCGNNCVDVYWDSNNCGGCGETCAATDNCDSATCSGPQACGTCLETRPAQCATLENTCSGNPDCVSLDTCIQGCADYPCENGCVEMYPNGLNDFVNLLYCTCDACTAECAGQCQ